MSDINVFVVHPEEIALVVCVWATVAAFAAIVFYKWRGRCATLWSLAVTVAGPPALLFAALGPMLLGK